LSTLTKLEELEQEIRNAAVAGANSAILFKEHQQMRIEIERKAQQARQEEERLKKLSPYLVKLPKYIREAGGKGLRVVYLDLPESDFTSERHLYGRRDYSVKTGSTTESLITYLRNAGLLVKTVCETSTDSGAYNETLYYHYYKLEIQF
jgi:hypothetical protein